MNHNYFDLIFCLHLTALLGTLQGNKNKYYTNLNDTNLCKGKLCCQSLNLLMRATEIHVQFVN